MNSKLPSRERTSLFLEGLLLFLFAVTFVLLNLHPIDDPDVFWHIKTGEWIWQHRALPDTDPFSFTSEPGIYKESVRPHFILKGYWLSQLIIYCFHNAFGLYGIILFRCLVYFGVISLLYFWMTRRGVCPIAALFFLIPLFLIMQGFGGERPNTISYLMALVCFSILEAFIDGGKRIGLVLPPFMFLWSLMHGGFLIGQVIIGLYLIAKVYEMVKTKAIVQTDIFQTVALLLSLIAPLVNKTARGAAALLLDMRGSLYSQRISENGSPFMFMQAGNYGFFVLVFFLILCIAVVIRSLSIGQISAAVFTLILSLSAVRYIPFFILLMTPLVAIHWSVRPSFNLYSAENKRLKNAMYVVLLFSMFYMGQRAYKNSILMNGPISADYPEAAAQFIKAKRPEGNLFNYYDWGGYLIYSLYPGKKVFIDGRGLSLALFNTYDETVGGSLKTYEGGKPFWKHILDAYRIDIVILPICKDSEGRIMNLNTRLIKDPEWSLIFIEEKNNALLFLRRRPDNEELIKKYSVKKELVYETALKVLVDDRTMSIWRKYLTSGLMNVYLGRYETAAWHFDKAIQIKSKLKSTVVYKGLERIRHKELPVFTEKEMDEIQSL